MIIFDNDILIEKHKKLIYLAIKKLHLSWRTEDEFQEYYDSGLLGLINGARTYSFDKGKESTYLYTCIKNMICRCMYQNGQFNRKINYIQKLSLDSTAYDNDDGLIAEIIPDQSINIEKEVENKMMLENIIKIAEKLLNNDNFAIFKKYYGLDGSPPKNIITLAKEYNCTRENISLKVRRSTMKIRDYLKRNDKDMVIPKEKKKELKRMEEKESKYMKAKRGIKTCSICNQDKPIEEYNFKTNENKYRKPYCKECEYQKNSDLEKKEEIQFIDNSSKTSNRLDKFKIIDDRMQEIANCITTIDKQRTTLLLDKSKLLTELETLKWVCQVFGDEEVKRK